jgi:hypothetical protein
LSRVTPYLLYKDVGAALEWLSRAFGFRERLRFEDDGGTITHAEMEVDGGEIMLGHPGPDYRSPKRLGQTTQLVHIQVDDVDAHFETGPPAARRSPRPPASPSYPRSGPTLRVAGAIACRGGDKMPSSPHEARCRLP